MSNDEKTVVLIADDEPSTLALLGRHLRSKGFNVLEASDGDEAWELAHEHLPDLVLLDVMMPGMSGWEVCRKIREAVSLAHTGVVMLTGIGETLNEMTSPLYGADAHVDKPFEFSVLDQKLSETLERRRAGALGRPDAAPEDLQVSFTPSDTPEPITTRKVKAKKAKASSAAKKATPKAAAKEPKKAGKAAPAEPGMQSKAAKKAKPTPAKATPEAKPAKAKAKAKAKPKKAKSAAAKPKAAPKKAPKPSAKKTSAAPKAKAAKKPAKPTKRTAKPTKAKPAKSKRAAPAKPPAPAKRKKK